MTTVAWLSRALSALSPGQTVISGTVPAIVGQRGAVNVTVTLDPAEWQTPGQTLDVAAGLQRGDGTWELIANASIGGRAGFSSTSVTLFHVGGWWWRTMASNSTVGLVLRLTSTGSVSVGLASQTTF